MIPKDDLPLAIQHLRDAAQWMMENLNEDARIFTEILVLPLGAAVNTSFVDGREIRKVRKVVSWHELGSGNANILIEQMKVAEREIVA